MEYPYVHNFNVKNIYGEQPVQITIYSGLTVFVGPNASGKTQTLKALRTSLKKVFGMLQLSRPREITIHFSHMIP